MVTQSAGPAAVHVVPTVVPRWRFARKVGGDCYDHGGVTFIDRYEVPSSPRFCTNTHERVLTGNDGRPTGIGPVCSRCRLPVDARVASVVIEAERWFDAKAYACAHFNADGDSLVWKLVGAGVHVDVVLAWVGHDAGAIPTRRMIAAVSQPGGGYRE